MNVSRAHAHDESAGSTAFLQERIALYAATLWLILLAISVMTFGLYYAYPATRPRQTGIIATTLLVGLGGLGALFFATRRGARTRRELAAFDLLLALGGGVLAGGAAPLVIEKQEQIAANMILLILLIVGRAILVPSSAPRTFWLSLGALGLMTGGHLVVVLRNPAIVNVPMPAYFIGGTAFALSAVALSALGSKIIFSLRRQVRDARRLGQYTLAEKIGEGAMGAVYKAHHALLRRPTAIKLLPPLKAGAEAIARFEREVQHTSALTHPNTVAIFDYGRSADGVFYYAMEYLDGIDLERVVLRHGPLPPARVIRILAQVCDALEEAHDRDLVHRDVKPANIILCHRGRALDVVKVVDFGLVKELRRAGGVAEGMAGTPAYLAPEAITSPRSIGAAADLYAVGAVGYFLLTGTTVFSGDSIVEICGHHVHSPVEPPSRRRPVPPELEALLLRCLAKAPADRPADAGALRDALRALPEAGAWSEPEVLAWWTEVERERVEPETGAASTIAVDLTERG